MYGTLIIIIIDVQRVSQFGNGLVDITGSFINYYSAQNFT